MKQFSYDERCEDLAKHFLADDSPTEEQVRDLAQTIQDAVEGWFKFAKCKPGAADVECGAFVPGINANQAERCGQTALFIIHGKARCFDHRGEA